MKLLTILAALLLYPLAAVCADKLTEAERIEIIRQISGEQVLVMTQLPVAEKHYKLVPPQPVKEGEIKVLSTKKGYIEAGSKVVITFVNIEDKVIVLDINGGGKEKRRLRDHISGGIGMGGQVAGVGGRNPIQQAQQIVGTTVVLEFKEDISNLNPDQLKKLLAPWFRFSNRSATVNWVATLPPQFQAGIKGRYPVEGMTKEMVEAAIGKADKKIRETDDYSDDETWIYGNPPGPTIFIIFENSLVTKIKKY